MIIIYTGPAMNIVVRHNARLLPHITNPLFSIGHLKNDIAALIGATADSFTLINDTGKRICSDDARSLSEYAIGEGSVVVVVKKRCGGAISRYTFVFWFMYLGLTGALALFMATGAITLGGEVYGVLFGDMLRLFFAKLQKWLGVKPEYFACDSPKELEPLSFWTKIEYAMFFLLQIGTSIFNYGFKHIVVVLFVYVLLATYFYPLILSIAQSSYYSVENDGCYALEHAKYAARILTIIFVVIYGSFQIVNVGREIVLAAFTVVFAIASIFGFQDIVRAAQAGSERTFITMADGFNQVKYYPLLGLLDFIGVGEALTILHVIYDRVGQMTYDAVMTELQYTDPAHGNMLVSLTLAAVRYFLFQIPFVGNILKYTYYGIDGIAHGIYRLYEYTDGRDHSWRLLNDIIKSGNVAGLVTAICFLAAVPIIVILTYFRHTIAEAMPEIEAVESFVEWVLKVIWKIFFSWWL